MDSFLLGSLVKCGINNVWNILYCYVLFGCLLFLVQFASCCMLFYGVDDLVLQDYNPEINRHDFVFGYPSQGFWLGDGYETTNH